MCGGGGVTCENLSGYSWHLGKNDTSKYEQIVKNVIMKMGIKKSIWGQRVGGLNCRAYVHIRRTPPPPNKKHHQINS